MKRRGSFTKRFLLYDLKMLVVLAVGPIAAPVETSLGDEAGHEAVGDGGTDPDLGEHIVGKLIGGLQIDVEVVKGGNEHIDDADEPEVALGVTLPVLARIEEGERAEQQHRQRETGQMDGVIGEGRRKEDVAQQHRYTHGDGTPVIELLGGDAT